MKKRSTELRKEAEKFLEKFNESKTLLELVEQEERSATDKMHDKIKKMCDKENMFVGAVLTKDEIVRLVKLALDTNENITIPFIVYLKD